MEWWQSLILGAAGASVPIVLSWFLGRKGANKKLEIDEGHLSVAQFDAATKAYQDLLDRAAKTIDELEEYKQERENLIQTVKEQGDKINELEKADELKTRELQETNQKLDTVRQLFEQYIARTGVPLTTSELAVFEQTAPLPFRRRSGGSQRKE